VRTATKDVTGTIADYDRQIQAIAADIVRAQQRERDLADAIRRADDYAGRANMSLTHARAQNSPAAVVAELEDTCRARVADWADKRRERSSTLALIDELHIRLNAVHRERRTLVLLGRALDVPPAAPNPMATDKALADLSRQVTELATKRAAIAGDVDEARTRMAVADGHVTTTRVAFVRGRAKRADLERAELDARAAMDAAAVVEHEHIALTDAITAVTAERDERAERVRTECVPAIRAAYRAALAVYFTKLREAAIAGEMAAPLVVALRHAGDDVPVQPWPELRVTTDHSKFIASVTSAIDQGYID
jgi:hypothetical protein